MSLLRYRVRPQAAPPGGSSWAWSSPDFATPVASERGRWRESIGYDPGESEIRSGEPGCVGANVGPLQHQ